MTDRPPELDRRAFLRGCSAAVLAVPLVAAVGGVAGAAPVSLPGVTVRPRVDWAADLPSGAPLAKERPGDVRVLVVHHSASANSYAPDEVIGQLRSFHALHTGPERGWPDVAYNFFVDRFGTVWEGRAGSLAGPVRPSATGGSQGFAQTCCFVGDHRAEPPTPEARRSMTLLLAGLADRYGVEPGATATFVSRGSTRWPAGVTVTTATIAGHRDLSETTCPGDAAYRLVKEISADVAAVLAARVRPTPASTTPSTAASSSRSPSTRAAATPSARPSASTEGREPGQAAAGAGRDDGTDAAALVLTGGVVAAGAALGVVRRMRRRTGTAGTGPSDDPPA